MYLNNVQIIKMLVNLRMKMKLTALSHIYIYRFLERGQVAENLKQRAKEVCLVNSLWRIFFNLSVLMLSLTFLNFHSQCRRAVKALASSFIKAFAARPMPHVLAHRNREDSYLLLLVVLLLGDCRRSSLLLVVY